MKRVQTKFTVYRAKDGGWRWRAKRAGKIVADSGETYNRLPACERSLTRFLDSVEDGAFYVEVRR